MSSYHVKITIPLFILYKCTNALSRRRRSMHCKGTCFVVHPFSGMCPLFIISSQVINVSPFIHVCKHPISLLVVLVVLVVMATAGSGRQRKKWSADRNCFTNRFLFFSSTFVQWILHITIRLFMKLGETANCQTNK